MGIWTKIKSAFGKGDSVLYKHDNGKESTLLNPHQKAQKAKAELRSNVRFTNDGVRKDDKDGIPLELTPVQRAYRAGYVSSTIDHQKVYWKNKNKNNK